MRGKTSYGFALLVGALAGFGCGEDAPVGGDAGPSCGVLDDGNDCTDDACVDNVVTHTPSARGSGCGAGSQVCDGDGDCVECVEDAGCGSSEVCNQITGACVGCVDDDDCGDGAVCAEAAGECVPATCFDGEQNADETGVDCGGGCAPMRTCAVGVGCEVGADCASAECGAGNVCAPIECGDGFLHPNEACDDGNDTNADGCDDGVGGSCRPTGCSNGTMTGTEACDDGNNLDGDGCDTNCTVTACGNGIVSRGEGCDDGATAGDDGCASDCTVEDFFGCTGEPSVCAPAMTIRIVDFEDGDRVGVWFRYQDGEGLQFCTAAECRISMPASAFGYALGADIGGRPVWTGCDSEGGDGACHVHDAQAVIEVVEAETLSVQVEGAGTVNVYEFIGGERLNPSNLLMSCTNATCVEDLGNAKLRLLAVPPAGKFVRWEGCTGHPDSDGGNQDLVCYAYAGDKVRATFQTPDTITVKQTGGLGVVNVQYTDGEGSIGTCATASCEFPVLNTSQRIRLNVTSRAPGEAGYDFLGCDNVARKSNAGRIHCYVNSRDVQVGVVTVAYDRELPFKVTHEAGGGSGTTRVSFRVPSDGGGEYGTCASTSASCDFQVASGDPGPRHKDDPYVRIDAEPAPGSFATFVSGCVRFASGTSNRCYTHAALADEVVIRYDGFVD